MRVRLKEGKQRELIMLSKKGLSWVELSKKVEVSRVYLSGDLRREKVLLSEDLYHKLSRLANKNFDNFIIEKLSDNWGKSKGGLNSLGSTIKLNKVPFNENLAEFIGAVLGDGNICFYKTNRKERKVGVYHIRIAGDLKKDKDYHLNYLGNLCKSLFNLKVNEILHRRQNERFLDIKSKELVNFFIDMGLKAGDKIKNNTTIPSWIFDNTRFLRVCVRGLIDTDGCIFRMSKRDPNLIRIKFTNHNSTLLKDTRKAFILLGFNPSEITCNREFYISRQDEIKKYLKEIGFSNKKHQIRLKTFQSSMV